jgi:hypothetical protein
MSLFFQSQIKPSVGLFGILSSQKGELGLSLGDVQVFKKTSPLLWPLSQEVAFL